MKRLLLCCSALFWVFVAALNGVVAGLRMYGFGPEGATMKGYVFGFVASFFLAAVFLSLAIGTSND